MSTGRIANVIVGLVATLWMVMTFATINNTSGNVVVLLGGALVVGVLTILMTYGHRINYLRIGDKILLEMDHGPTEREGQLDDSNEREPKRGRGRNR